MKAQEVAQWVARQTSISAEMRDQLIGILDEVTMLRADLQEIAAKAERYDSDQMAWIGLEECGEIAQAGLKRGEEYG